MPAHHSQHCVAVCKSFFFKDRRYSSFTKQSTFGENGITVWDVILGGEIPMNFDHINGI